MNKKINEFQKECEVRIKENSNNLKLLESAKQFNIESNKSKYSYNFKWLGRPIIQYPQDIIAMQELIWEIKPDLIIETGIAHGGSLILYASILELIGNGEVVGIDIDIRRHNKIEIETHSMYKRITMIEGSSVNKDVVKKVQEVAKNKKKVMVLLDSNHTHSHVLKELELYANFTSVGSYCIVFDTVVEDLPKNYMPGGRPWNPGNSPKSAVFEFLKKNNNFEIDKSIDNKILISVAPDGYLKRIK